MCNRAYQNDLEKHFLVDLHELLVPLLDVCGLLAVLALLFVAGEGVVAVVLTVLDDLAKNSLVDLE